MGIMTKDAHRLIMTKHPSHVNATVGELDDSPRLEGQPLIGDTEEILQQSLVLNQGLSLTPATND
jgi:hypothetical protein